MRIPMLAGALLIVVGAFLLFSGSFTSHRSVLDVGGLTVTAEEQHPVRPWIAGVVLVAGLVLVVTDLRRKA
jgi:uncharacterized membrane protein